MDALRNGVPTMGVPVVDRGLAYGDGLFETIKVVERAGAPAHPEFLSLHLERLQRDCARLDMRVDIDALRAEVGRVLAAGRSGVLKVIVTRAATQRGYQAPRSASAQRLVLFHQQSFAAPHATGVAVRLCRQRLAEQPALAGMKHLNRLEQVLARAEWSDPSIAEGLLLDTAGRLVEGVSSNVYVVCDGVVLTPRLHRCGVRGVVRELLLREAPAAGIALREADLSLDDLLRAAEVFLSNSVFGIVPVAKIDCLHKPRGDVTIALQNLFQTLCSRDALAGTPGIGNR